MRGIFGTQAVVLWWVLPYTKLTAKRFNPVQPDRLFNAWGTAVTDLALGRRCEAAIGIEKSFANLISIQRL